LSGAIQIHRVLVLLGARQKRGDRMVTALILAILASLAGLALLFVSWPPPRPSWLRRLVTSIEGGNRSALKPLLNQLNAGVLLDVIFVGAGAGAPTNGEGDPNAIWLTITRQGVGKYTIKTVDPWLAVTASAETSPRRPSRTTGSSTWAFRRKTRTTRGPFRCRRTPPRAARPPLLPTSS